MGLMRLLRGLEVFRRRIAKEITRVRISSENLEERQIGKLKYVLPCKSESLDKSPSFLDPSVSALMFNAYRFVSLNATVGLYTKCAPNGRPYQVWLYDHEHRTHSKLFEEPQSSCTVDVALTRDRKYVTINSNTRTSSEVSIIKSHDLLQTSGDLSQLPVLLRSRQDFVEYYIEHAHNRFYIFTNLGQDMEYRVMVADSCAPGTWMDFYRPPDTLKLQDMEFFDKAILLYGMKELVPVVMVIDPQRDKEPVVLSEDNLTFIDKTAIEDDAIRCYYSNSWPVCLSSPIHPPSLYTISLDMVAPIEEIDHGVEKYCIERVSATSKDGVEVPMTMCYRRDLVKNGRDNPALVHVYGSYGESLFMGYQPEKVPLLDRGWVLVYCHVRGGGEQGRRWYHGGMGENKHNTFDDLHACVRELHTRLSQPRLTAISGRSAGGLAVGMFCNLWPHLLQAAILQVPLVNMMDSLSDSSLYLSSKDYLEFGNPLASEVERKHISSICPYSRLKPQDYPAMLISAAFNDEVIPFDGVFKYVSKLKSCVALHRKQQRSGLARFLPLHWNKIDRGTVLFDVDYHYGHQGSGDWKLKTDMASMQVEFLYKALSLELA